MLIFLYIKIVIVYCIHVKGQRDLVLLQCPLCSGQGNLFQQISPCNLFHQSKFHVFFLVLVNASLELLFPLLIDTHYCLGTKKCLILFVPFQFCSFLCTFFIFGVYSIKVFRIGIRVFFLCGYFPGMCEYSACLVLWISFSQGFIGSQLGTC